MASPTNHTLVSELSRADRLLEVGIGRRPDVARALAERGCEVIAIDVDEAVLEMHGEEIGADDRSCRTCYGDVVTLANAPDPIASLPIDVDAANDDALAEGRPEDATDETGIDAVYALNLPAELQRPTVDLARRLDAACSFTTLGFEEPAVPVRRRSVDGDTLYVAHEHAGERRRPGGGSER